jgi:hypothetical protein
MALHKALLDKTLRFDAGPRKGRVGFGNPIQFIEPLDQLKHRAAAVGVKEAAGGRNEAVPISDARHRFDRGSANQIKGLASAG